MKFFKLLFAFTFITALLFTSCTKEDVAITTTDTPEEVIPGEKNYNSLANRTITRSEDGISFSCFSIDLPFSLEINGTAYEFTSTDDLDDFDFSDSIYSIDFVYPISITYDDGTNKTIENGHDLDTEYVNCIPDDGWGAQGSFFGVPGYLISTEYGGCYDLVYPVTLVHFKTEENITANDEDELIAILVEEPHTWYFSFPLSLTDVDGNSVEVEDYETLVVLLAECFCNGEGIYGTIDSTINTPPIPSCFEFKYPFSMKLFDMISNTTIEKVLNERTDLLLLNGYQFVDFVYPIIVIVEEEEQEKEITISSYKEFDDFIVEYCY